MLEFDECVLEKVSGSPKLKLGFCANQFCSSNIETVFPCVHEYTNTDADNLKDTNTQALCVRHHYIPLTSCVECNELLIILASC